MTPDVGAAEVGAADVGAADVCPTAAGVAGVEARTLLVIEDDDDVRELLLSHVRGLGWTAAGADSGSDGFARALADRPAAVVVDILLPDLDGRQVIRALRGDARTADCRIVLNSVLDRDDYLPTLGGVRIDAVLPKPFSRRDVSLLLEALEQGTTGDALTTEQAS